MATVAFKTDITKTENYYVFAFSNEHETTLIQDYLKYDSKQINAKYNSTKGKSRGRGFVIRTSYVREHFEKLYDLFDKAIREGNNDESKLREMIPFADKWDVTSQQFKKELWDESEFLAQMLEEDIETFFRANETKSGHVINSVYNSQYDDEE